MTTTEKRRRYLTGDISNESDDDQGEILNANPQKTTKRRVSATGDFAATHRFIVSERRQLAVLKQLTATNDETTNSSTTSSNPQSQRPVKIFRRNEHGETIAHIAARKGDIKRLKKALEEGANVNEADNAGWTPLHEAVTKNQYKAASLLLKSGANVNAPGPEGQTPLIDAVLNSNTKIVNLLLTYSADPSVIDMARLNETMIQVFNRELTTFDVSENENEDDELSRSSPINSADEFEQEEKNLSDFSAIKRTFPKTASSTIETNLMPKNPYDFESDNDDEIKTENPGSMFDDLSTSDTEINYRVPPIRIVLARTILPNNENSNMDEDTPIDSSSLPTIEENEQLLSTIITTSASNNLDDENQTIISDLMAYLLLEIESNSCEEENLSKQEDVKSITRTLRSHAKEKLSSSPKTSHFNDRNRRMSNRRRAFDRKSFAFEINEIPRRKKTISERSNATIETSSNSDDQDRNVLAEDDDIDDNNSNLSSKQTDLNYLPPNKRRLHERNHGLEVSNPMEENLPMKGIPVNGIKQFLEIRQEIEKRHKSMLKDFVMPKIPKDFAETLMAKKTYLITPLNRSVSNTTPASLGIKRLPPPSDLDIHLTDVFNKQEDERYRMKLRHQVEREKLILSHEQEILRLYGNASRSSINQEIPLSYCSILRDNEVYNNKSIQQRPAIYFQNDAIKDDLNKRTKTPWNEQTLCKLIEESNEKYKRLSCEINQRQYLELNTLYSMQKMVWLKHIPKEMSALNRMNSLLSERYLPKVDINTNFWTHWEMSSIS